jgi:FdhE protein
MPGTASGLRTDITARLAELERQRPEWHAWLGLLSEAERALDDAGWRTPLDQTELADRSAGSPVDAPLLNRRTLRVDATRVQRLTRRLSSTAASAEATGARSLRDYRPSTGDAMALLRAAIRQDRDELAALADEAGVDRGALTSVAQLAAFPLLQSCGRLLEDRVPRFWPHGYCPICGAWPILAERRGLDRTRRLRCGRCAGEWEIQWLCCTYCGERDHEKLGSLIADGAGEMLKVETCASCRGYLKSVATLQGISAFELLLQDLETVELDLVAVDRGYTRPQENGFSLDVRLT